MRVLLVSPLPPPHGGIASWTVNCLKYLSDNDLDVNITHVNSAQKLVDITNTNVWLRIYYGVRVSLSIIFDLKKKCKLYDIDVIHLTSSASFSLLKDFFILKYAKARNIPLIVHWRFGRIPQLAQKRNLEWKLMYYIIRKCHTSIVLDENSYQALAGGGIKSRIVKIPNPISINVENRAKIVKDEDYQRPNGSLIFVGHVIKNKGVFELVKSCREIPEVKKLTIVGLCESAIKDELITLAKLREDGKWLKLLGALEHNEVLEEMKKHKILVLPSYTEGFPNALIEAMAMKCSIIATEVGAIPEMLGVSQKVSCGICIPPKNTDKLTEAISLLIKNERRLEILGKNGNKMVLQNYSIHKIMQEYKNVWEEAVNI